MKGEHASSNAVPQLPCPAPRPNPEGEGSIFASMSSTRSDVAAIADAWFAAGRPVSSGPVIIRDEALRVAILRNQQLLWTALLGVRKLRQMGPDLAAAPPCPVPSSPDPDGNRMAQEWLGPAGGMPGSAGPVTIRGEALLAAMLGNQQVLKRLVLGEAVDGMVWSPAPKDITEVRAMASAWYRNGSPTSAGPVAIRGEALLVGLLRNQQALCTAAGGGELPCPAPLPGPDESGILLNTATRESDVGRMAAAWFAEGVPQNATARIVTRGESFLVAAMTNQTAMLDALAQPKLTSGLMLVVHGRDDEEPMDCALL